MHDENVKVSHANVGRMVADMIASICDRRHYILCYTSCIATYQNDKKIMRICRFFCSLHYAGVSPRQAR